MTKITLKKPEYSQGVLYSNEFKKKRFLFSMDHVTTVQENKPDKYIIVYIPPFEIKIKSEEWENIIKEHKRIMTRLSK